MKLRTRLATIAAATLALSAVGSAPAQASHGWVANSCAVQQSLHALVKHAPEGDYYAFIPCGTGLSGVESVTAGRYPFYVNPEGPTRPFCLEVGMRYHPNSAGAVITPTVRC